MRLIDADSVKYEPLPKGDRNYRTYNLDDAYDDGYDDAFTDIRNAPTIDAIPGSFIQELIERGKQLIEEYRGKPDYGIIVDGLIERVVNYEVLIEKWREKNGTETD